MRHIWATTPPGVKGRQKAAFAAAKCAACQAVHDLLTI